MCRSVLCARPGCNVRFHPRGNQRYCSPACSREARRLQNRLAKRRQRLRQYLAGIEEARKRGRPIEVSAVHARHGPFLLPVRRLRPTGPPPSPPALRLLL